MRLKSLPREAMQTVAAYNREDCLSTMYLRDWLETIRKQLIEEGRQIQRPSPKSGEPSEEVGKRRQEVIALMDRLLKDVPLDVSTHTAEQHAKWLIANMLEFHRRETNRPGGNIFDSLILQMTTF
jgi:hypothetical protein